MDRSVRIQNQICLYTYPTSSESQKVFVDQKPGNGSIVVDTKYTLRSNDFTCYPYTYTFSNPQVVTGFSTFIPANTTKPDISKNKVKLTLKNSLVPATRPDGFTYLAKLSVWTPNKTKPKIYRLEDNDKFAWTFEPGVLTVEYLIKDCRIKAKSNVTAEVCVNWGMCFFGQPIAYEEEAKSVSSVVAALVAVLALVL
ncbi:hypothetical protein BLNAU_8729 [Blattamonas nauphoetae]|uniref:Uncharacterized protein n=1 Tax=Blattamonas nauphoetae TaxID=2049346 RepID=A0ABQ9XY15_9EUKA|nr:hypothetical protein BLNAU_8729 [Blattamonas nauphoetae]